MPQGLIRIAMPLLMVLAFLIYVLVQFPEPDSAVDPEPASEAAK